LKGFLVGRILLKNRHIGSFELGKGVVNSTFVAKRENIKNAGNRLAGVKA